MTEYGGHGFEEFVHAEFPRLWRLGRVLSGRDDDAWDLAQESLVKVGLHWSRIDRNGNPGAYARTCLVRLHIAGPDGGAGRLRSSPRTSNGPRRASSRSTRSSMPTRSLDCSYSYRRDNAPR